MYMHHQLIVSYTAVYSLTTTKDSTEARHCNSIQTYKCTKHKVTANFIHKEIINLFMINENCHCRADITGVVYMYTASG